MSAIGLAGWFRTVDLCSQKRVAREPEEIHLR